MKVSKTKLTYLLQWMWKRQKRRKFPRREFFHLTISIRRNKWRNLMFLATVPSISLWSSLMPCLGMTVLKITMPSSLIKTQSFTVQEFHTPYTITSQRKRKCFTAKTREELVQLQLIRKKNILLLAKKELGQIFTSMNILALSYIAFWERERRNHTVVLALVEMENY